MVMRHDCGLGEAFMEEDYDADTLGIVMLGRLPLNLGMGGGSGVCGVDTRTCQVLYIIASSIRALQNGKWITDGDRVLL